MSYKKRATVVLRSLALFDSADEWADYISFLGKLFKTIRTPLHQPSSKNATTTPTKEENALFGTDVIESKVASCLGACLHVNLPSGVHVKTLEVYSHVFSVLGSEELGRKTHVWVPGLLSIMSHASISVKPLIVNLFDSYILELPNDRLRILLKSLLLSFLPGIDDESSESFDAVLQLIDKLKDKVGNQQFWQCFCLCVVESQDRRLGALIYMTKRLPLLIPQQELNDDDQEQDEEEPEVEAEHDWSNSKAKQKLLASLSSEAISVITPESGLLIRAFTKGLTDPQLLVQRGFFDLLLKNLPLDSGVLQVYSSISDIELLISSACSTVLKKDMSLNRRLWNWLLGPSQEVSTPASPHFPTSSTTSNKFLTHEQYFTKYGYTPLTNALLKQIISPNSYTVQNITKPFKISLSLMDRWEIGSKVVPIVLSPILEKSMSYSATSKEYSVSKINNSSNDDFVFTEDEITEIIISASSFFDGVEAINIYSDIFSIIIPPKSLSAADTDTNTDIKVNYELLEFILKNFNVKEEEMIVLHLPLMLLALLILQNKKIDDRKDTTDDSDAKWYKITEMILDLIPERAFIPPHHSQTSKNLEDLDDVTILKRISSYYAIQTNSTSDSNENFDRSNGGGGSLDVPFQTSILSLLLLHTITKLTSKAISSRDHNLKYYGSLVYKIVGKIPEMGQWRDEILISELISLSGSSGLAVENYNPQFTYGLILSTLSILPGLTSQESYSVISTSISSLFELLSDRYGKYQVEVGKLLWELDEKLILKNNSNNKNRNVNTGTKISGSIIEANLANLFIDNDSENEMSIYDKVRIFQTLWIHRIDKSNDMITRSLFLLLDNLKSTIPSNEGSLFNFYGNSDSIKGNNIGENSLVVSTWINSTLHSGTSNNLFYSLLKPITSFPLLSRSTSNINIALDDLDTLAYFLKTFYNVLCVARPGLKKSFENESVVGDANLRAILSSKKPTSGIVLGESNYKSILINLVLKIISYHPPTPSTSNYNNGSIFSLNDIVKSFIDVNTHSLNLLELLITGNESYLDIVISTLINVIIGYTTILTSYTNDEDKDSGSEYSFIQIKLLKLLNKMIKFGSKQKIFIHDIFEDITIPKHKTITGQNTITNDSFTKQVQFLNLGISSSKNEIATTCWNDLLIDLLTLMRLDNSESFYQNLIPLVDCNCLQIANKFELLKNALNDNNNTIGESQNNPGIKQTIDFDQIIFTYFSSLEQMLSIANTQLGQHSSSSSSASKVNLLKNSSDFSTNNSGLSASSPVNTIANTGFFGVMSGVFAVESPTTNHQDANNRLSVILCFQDAIKTAYNIWTWAETYNSINNSNNRRFDVENGGISESSVYHSSRLKFRSKKIMEKLYSLETQEMLETLIEIGYINSTNTESRIGNIGKGHIFKLLHILDGARPRMTISHLFDSILKRSNSSNNYGSKSPFTTELSDQLLVSFLNDYTASLESDAIEEVWNNITGFLKETLTSITQFKHLYPNLLKFLGLLGVKLSKVQFGQSKKIQKELGDFFTKMLSIVLASRTSLTVLEPVVFDNNSDLEGDTSSTIVASEFTGSTVTGDKVTKEELCNILGEISINLNLIVPESDRVIYSVSLMLTSLFHPLMKSKTYPSSAPNYMVKLLSSISGEGTTINNTVQNSKAWKTIVSDTYTDPRFFQLNYNASKLWAPIISKWVLMDKSVFNDYVSRISVHSSNTTNVLFGWSDQEATTRTLNIQKITYILMVGEKDQFLTSLKELSVKLNQVLCSNTGRYSIKSDVFLCIRAMVLRFSETHLSFIWNILHSELQTIFMNLVDNLTENETIDLITLTGACKLLDMLLIVGFEDFRLDQWLFITDNMDAIFKSAEHPPFGIIDKISEAGLIKPNQRDLDSEEKPHILPTQYINTVKNPKKKLPLLSGLIPKKVKYIYELRRFFDSLSLQVYEDTYSLAVPDIKSCEEDVLHDLFSNP